MIKYWLILHDVRSYLEHKDKIGHTQKGRICGIKKGDKIVYYAITDEVIIGTFGVTSNLKHGKISRGWSNDWYFYYKTRPINLAKSPYYLEFNNVIAEKKLDIMRGGKKPVLFGITRKEISKKDFSIINDFLTKKIKRENLFSEYTDDEGIGDDIDLEIMKHEPTNEQGVVALFAKFMEKLEYGFTYFEFIRQGFPDASVWVKEKDGKKRRKYVEFEFKSSQFKTHVKNPEHNKIKCDYVVCWEHDYFTCPVKVIELKTELKYILKKND